MNNTLFLFKKYLISKFVWIKEQNYDLPLWKQKISGQEGKLQFQKV